MALETIYLISGGPYCKIGRTYNLENRLRTIQTTHPYPLTVAKVWQVSNGLEVERYLHQRFASFKMHGEWFQLPVHEVEALISVKEWHIEKTIYLAKVPTNRGVSSIAPERQRQIRRKGRLWTCERCGWQWKTLSGKRPKRCAEVKCRSPYWDQPRTGEEGNKDGGGAGLSDSRGTVL
jgi:hypothetical protein